MYKEGNIILQTVYTNDTAAWKGELVERDDPEAPWGIKLDYRPAHGTIKVFVNHQRTDNFYIDPVTLIAWIADIAPSDRLAIHYLIESWEERMRRLLLDEKEK